MTDKILNVEDLSIQYNENEVNRKAVKQVSFSLEVGKTLGIVGESGSGKSSIAHALMRLLDREAQITGEIHYKGQLINQLKEKKYDECRGKSISIVFQNQLDVFNPIMTIENQLLEVLKKHKIKCHPDFHAKIQESLHDVGLDTDCLKCYPHELSGGMRQKALIAMAIICNPEVLIVDEPTTALDTLSKKEIITLLKKFRDRKGMAMIVISHDMDVIMDLSDYMIVLHQGSLVEEGPTKDMIHHPMHAYTKRLIGSAIELNPFQDLWGIPQVEKNTHSFGCSFYSRCYQKTDSCLKSEPKLRSLSKDRKIACHLGGIQTLLECKGVSKSYISQKRSVKACKKCSLHIKSGEIVSLIGSSGSGKTTLANILAGYLKKDEGEIIFDGNVVLKEQDLQEKQSIQMVFQDPFSSTNEYFSVLDTVVEPLKLMRIGNESERLDRVKKALLDVHLSSDQVFYSKKLRHLSGGERQRVALARALVMKPKLLIADELSAMLDPSVKANLFRLIKQLQNHYGFSMLFITHDLYLARKISDRAYWMHQGEILCSGSSLEVFPKIFDNNNFNWGIID